MLPLWSSSDIYKKKKIWGASSCSNVQQSVAVEICAPSHQSHSKETLKCIILRAAMPKLLLTLLETFCFIFKGFFFSNRSKLLSRKKKKKQFIGNCKCDTDCVVKE